MVHRFVARVYFTNTEAMNVDRRLLSVIMFAVDFFDPASVISLHNKFFVVITFE